MKDLLKHLPNALTAGNLVFGLLALEQVFLGNSQLAFYFILVSAVLDFFDGFAARLLNVTSGFGKELDSLADLVTFGVVPGMVIYFYMMQNGICTPEGFCSRRYLFLFVPLFGALRLARFNSLPPDGTYHFKGVPIPASGIAVASLPMIKGSGMFLESILSNEMIWMMIPLFVSFLMVSELPMMSMKFKSAKWSDNKEILILIGGVAIPVIIWGVAGVILSYLFYVLFSLLTLTVLKKK